MTDEIPVGQQWPDGWGDGKCPVCAGRADLEQRIAPGERVRGTAECRHCDASVEFVVVEDD